MSSILVNASAKVSTADGPVPGLTRSLSLTQSGSRYVCQMQTVTTTPETMVSGDCADFRYASVLNPAASAQTLTVSCAPMVLKPGDVAVFPPSSTAVTLQATGAANVQVFAAEA